MSVVQWMDGIAVQLMEVCLDDVGHLRRNEFSQSLVQAALLLDLHRAGRLELDDDRNWIDTSPTGFPPADDLLTAVQAEPDRSMKYWIGRGPRPMLALVGWLLDNDLWQLRAGPRHGGRARYDVIGTDASTFDQRMSFYNALADSGPAPTSCDATVTCLALLGRLVWGRSDAPRDDLIRQCGPDSWLVRYMGPFLDEARELRRRAGNMMGSQAPL